MINVNVLQPQDAYSMMDNRDQPIAMPSQIPPIGSRAPQLGQPLGTGGETPLPSNYSNAPTSDMLIHGENISPTTGYPPIGLIGSEQALLGGHLGAEDAISGGIDKSKNYLLGGTTGGINSLTAGYAGASNILGSFNPTYQAATNSFSADTGVGKEVTDPLNQGAANFGTYMGYGNSAAKMQADLSGANGAQAQQAAYSAYQSSPAMQYQMDQMQKATERSAAARGGALGGNVLLELQRNAAGIASQDYQNQFNNIGTVAQQGLSAAGQVANLKGQEAGIAGSLKQTGINANLQSSLANQQAENRRLEFEQEQKFNIANKLADMSRLYGIDTSNLLGRTGEVLAQNELLGGSKIADYRYNTGTNLATGRTSAGEAIANNAKQTASQLESLVSQQGVNITSDMAASITNIGNILSEYGMQDKISNESLAKIIANITGGQGTDTGNAYANIGQIQASGALSVGNAISNGITTALGSGAFTKTPTTAGQK